MNEGAPADMSYSDYREYPVPAELAGEFLCFWTQEIGGSRGNYLQRVLPDGCADIVFLNEEEPLVVGPWIEPFMVPFAPGTRILGARLHPGRAGDFLRLPAADLLNRSEPLRAIWGSRRAAGLGRVADESGLPSRRSAMASALREATRRAAPRHSEITPGIRWLARHPEAKVEDLARRIGISNRQLQRRFSDGVGYGPKMFQSILRFQRLLNLAEKETARGSLAQLSARAGYADQAHITREVGRFAHSTPKMLLASARSTLQMSDLFKTSEARED